MSTTKPDKPWPGFPLYAHASGRWAKKIKGKFHYFGRWDDPGAAYTAYCEFRDAQAASSVSGPAGYTLVDACNDFLTAKEDALLAGEISQHTFADYRRTCEWLAKHFGRDVQVAEMGPQDFTGYRSHLATRRSLRSMGNEIGRVRAVFRWLKDSNLADVQLGPDFKKPKLSAIRKAAAGKPKKLFTRGEILLLLDECGIHMRAMALLGINCAYGPGDCWHLERKNVDLDAGWIVYPRPKTGVARRSPLWPETVDALRTSLSRRQGTGKLFFARADGSEYDQQWISKRWRQVCDSALVKSRGTFYWLRHTFETVAGETLDQVAVDCIMGHADHTMAGVYRQEIGDDRLAKVVQHVRAWLLSPD
jgi:integrase